MSEPATHPASTLPGAGAPNGAPAGRRYLCPYCGEVTLDPRRCGACGGHLDPLSRQATQNTMGPWQIHDPAHTFRPGCSFAVVRRLVERGQISRRTILRGPTTRQFWTFADRAPSVANLLGVCHNCHAEVAPEAFLCAACGASFTPETDRQYLGLAPRRPLPGEAPADQVAHLASDTGLSDRSRRGEQEHEGLEGARIQRPAFPADPRPARPKRSPVAVIALVAVAGVIGLSLGAAGALAVVAGVGLIDLSGDPERSPERELGDGLPAARELEEAPRRSPARELGDGPDASHTGLDPTDAPNPAPRDGRGNPADPQPAPAPPGAETQPPPAPAVPPRLRRLP